MARGEACASCAGVGKVSASHCSLAACALFLANTSRCNRLVCSARSASGGSSTAKSMPPLFSCCCAGHVHQLPVHGQEAGDRARPARGPIHTGGHSGGCAGSAVSLHPVRLLQCTWPPVPLWLLLRCSRVSLNAPLSAGHGVRSKGRLRLGVCAEHERRGAHPTAPPHDFALRSVHATFVISSLRPTFDVIRPRLFNRASVRITVRYDMVTALLLVMQK